jgi:hypothetical protein
VALSQAANLLLSAIPQPVVRTLAPEILKTRRTQFGVPNRMLNVFVAEVSLQRAGVVSSVREGIATGVTKHVGVNARELGRRGRSRRSRSRLDLPVGSQSILWLSPLLSTASAIGSSREDIAFSYSYSIGGTSRREDNHDLCRAAWVR